MTRAHFFSKKQNNHRAIEETPCFWVSIFEQETIHNAQATRNTISGSTQASMLSNEYGEFSMRNFISKTEAKPERKSESHCFLRSENRDRNDSDFPKFKDVNPHAESFHKVTNLKHARDKDDSAKQIGCDTHPRFSPDGISVVIDSPHGGDGRQMYLIDISEIVKE